MSASLARCAVLALALAASGGCSSTPELTELVLVIRADMPVNDLYVSVSGPEGISRVDERIHAPALPLSIVMTRDHAPYGPVNIHVEGGAVASDTTTELVPGQRRRLEITLSSTCRCTACSATQTCRGGTCADRHVAPETLPTWVAGSDASVAPAHDAGVVRDAGAPADGGVCGCQGQACCGGVCASTYSCRMDVCLDCQQTDPTIMGGPAMGMIIPSVSATGNMLEISVSNGTTIDQVGFALSGGLRATGTAPLLGQLEGMSGSGSTITLRGMGSAMGHLGIEGATVSGSFMAPMFMGMEGKITRVSASGHVLTLTASDGTMGTLTFTPIETCR